MGAELLKETVNGVQLYNAIWRCGPDRRVGVAITMNLAEEKNCDLQTKLVQIVQQNVLKPGSPVRSELPALIKRLEQVFGV